nr:BatD family protein [Aggregatimonas sangjinii]
MRSTSYEVLTKKSAALVMRCLVMGLFLLYASNAYTQTTPKIASEVDTTFIKIGEQVTFKVTVEVDSTAQVIFPDGQTFSPLETVEASDTDTVLRQKERMTLLKTYALTQFDSGAYKLPTQRIEIDGKGYFTDSLMINVATVPVDTLKQQMFDIKPLIQVERTSGSYWKLLLGILGALLLIAGLFYWFVFRKKPLSEAEKEALLPPYDRALMELKRLENSRYLIQDEYKQYYSELTDIVRSYLEEDVHVSALESTTDQLIEKLELLKDSGELELDTETIVQFKKILQTADLVKFAKSKPDTLVAEQDRKTIEQIVVKTHDALPEPTEEELMQQAEYQEEFMRRKQRKKLVIGIVVLFGVLFTGAAIAVANYGFSYLKDSILGHPTKELLEGEWVASSYGFPPIVLETPKVLVRKQIELPEEAQKAIKELQAFEYSSQVGLFDIGVSSVTYKEPIEAPIDQTIEQLLQTFQAAGAKNIITKDDVFTTISGVKGTRVYGSGKFKSPSSEELIKGKYEILVFGAKGFQQTIGITYLEDDAYAQQIVDRIKNTLEVKLEL